jgi:CDP-paratose synthetase
MDAIKTILLTGATGYLGSNLAKAFVENGYKLVLLKRENSDIRRIKSIIPNIVIYNIDECDLDVVFQRNNIDCIINTVASYGRKNESLVEIYQANLIFPARLLDYSIKHKVKYFLNTGTSLPPELNVYALSKNQFVELLKLNKHKINTLNIKLEYFYGPDDDNSKFVSLILSKLLAGEKMIEFSQGIQLRDFIYIKDVVSAFLVLITNLSKQDEYLDVSLGFGQVYTLRQIAEKIKCAVGSNAILKFGALPMRDGELMYSKADPSFLKTLGWIPMYDFDKGITETINIEKILRNGNN